MKKNISIIVTVLIVAGFLTGCFEAYDEATEFKRTRETKALRFLKKYQTAASIQKSEIGRYGSLSELYEDGAYQGLISKAFYQAWDGHDSPQSLNGYLFSWIENYGYGDEIDSANFAGLCAYPDEPGVTGDLIICVLADPRRFESEAVNLSGGVSKSKEWRFYAAMYSDFGGGVYNWPSDEELEEKFQLLKQGNPEKGLRQAQRLADEILNQE